MVEVRQSGKSIAERLNDRLRNSGDASHADVTHKAGDGVRRVFTNIHHSANHVPLPKGGDGDADDR
jgi:hypothetical protein